MKQKILKPLIIGAVLVAAALPSAGATNDLAATLQAGLFEEEANHDLEAAARAYQAVADRFDQDRKLAATAIFRLGECYRKQAKTNEANALYERILREFSDQSALVSLSRQNLGKGGAEGVGPASPAPVSKAANLAAAIEANEVQEIQGIIKNSPDLIHAKDETGSDRFQKAARDGHLTVARFLLDNGADLNTRDSSGNTPLHAAASSGHKAVLDFLLAQGADVNARNKSGHSPLHAAAERGFKVVAETLLTHKADVNARANDQRTPLHLAAAAAQPAMAAFLASKGADLQALDERGATPLSCAVQRRDYDTVKTLLDLHADPNAGGADLPLQVAAVLNDSKLLILLLENGAKPDKSAVLTMDSRLRGVEITPLGIAVSRDRLEAAKTLLRFKADPNVKSESSASVLLAALSNTNMILALLEAGADPNCRTDDGTTPLSFAVSAGNEALATMLLAHGANPAESRNGWTLLHTAAQKGSAAIARLLVEKGADPNARDRDGSTPLHIAINAGSEDVATVLLDHKADPNARNGEGATPLELANRRPPSFPGGAQSYGPGRSPFPVSGPPGQIPTRTLRLPPGARTVTASEGVPNLAELLRQRGAIEDPPHMGRIMVRRPSTGLSGAIFMKGTNDWNQFTLLDLFAVQYEFLTTSPGVMRSRSSPYEGFARGNGLEFPDLAHIRIRRPGPDLKSWQVIPVDVAKALATGDCPATVSLQWGDVVEVPETDHVLGQKWEGLSTEALAALKKCLTRRVDIVVKGQKTTVTLEPDISIEEGKPVVVVHNATFNIQPVLQNSKLLLASSDLSRILLKRRDPKTGTVRERTVDCRSSQEAPRVWLLDGDVIEVPEKK